MRRLLILPYLGGITSLIVSSIIIFSMPIYFHQAAAYYFHGLILDEGKSHGMAAAALQVAVESLEESKKLSAAFDATPPLSR